MIYGSQGLRKKQYEDKDKYKYNRQAYDIMCFWKGDDNRSLIMKNVQNMQNMQNMRNMRNMQNLQNISQLFSRQKTKKLHT